MNELSKAAAELIQSLNGGAQAFGEALQRVSPEAWRIAVYQVQINGFRFIAAWCFLAAVVFVIGLKFRQIEKRLRADGKKEATAYYIATWVAMSLASVIAVTSVCINFDKIINPQYEAGIKILSNLRALNAKECGCK